MKVEGKITLNLTAFMWIFFVCQDVTVDPSFDSALSEIRSSAHRYSHYSISHTSFMGQRVLFRM